MARSISALILLAFLGSFGTSALGAQTPAQPEPGGVEQLHQAFLHPPDEARIMMRWWWFGPAVTHEQITRDLKEMKAAGIGGVEVAFLYALALDDPEHGLHNMRFLSDEHIEALRFAASEARRLGLRIDVTLGSGWPLGGPAIPVTQAAGMLRVDKVEVAAGATSAPRPAIGQGEQWLAAFLMDSAPSAPAGRKRVGLPESGPYKFAAAAGPRQLLTFLSSRTGMQVKRPAVGAEGFVLDHYAPAAISTHLEAVGDRLLEAFGDHPPTAVFSDSLEDYGSDWTPQLLGEFERRRGYDLRPYLPELVLDLGPESAAVRHDWGRTLTELADDYFLSAIAQWAHEHNTLFRSQSYGYPPISLYSNRLADLPEGEGKASLEMARRFSDLRWAASAGHLFGHNVISSETWTWLDSPAFRATPLDMKAEADLHFLTGINQLVGHGWPSSPASVGEPGFRMYAAAALNAHNPWFFAMPELAGYLQRVSFALRLGEPVRDVAILLPNDDVWARFRARIDAHSPKAEAGGFDETGSNVTLDEQMDRALGPRLIASLLDAGFNPDFIDADTIDALGIPYKALVLPPMDRIPVSTLKKIREFSEKGGIVLAQGRSPSLAPGLANADGEGEEIRRLAQEIFERGRNLKVQIVPDEAALARTLAVLLEPDLKLDAPNPAIGFLHRHLAEGDLYFFANTSNQPARLKGQVRAGAARAELWDAFTGKTSGFAAPERLDFEIEPYGSRLVFFSPQAAPGVVAEDRKETTLLDLDRDWIYGDCCHDQAFTLDRLRSWTELPGLAGYSGQIRYTRSFDLKALPKAGERILLDFGEARPLPLPSSEDGFNMRAYLDPPVREAARVTVNGHLAGLVWRPPYRLEITPWLEPGHNQLAIEVGNTAINELAAQPPASYRLLRQRYGLLFTPQDMENLKPLPSGLLGPVRLVRSAVVETGDR